MGVGGHDGGPRGRLAILHPAGAMALGRNPFGKDVANLQLWRALAQHGGYLGIDVLTLAPVALESLREELFAGAPSDVDLTSGLLPHSHALPADGALLRGHVDLADLGWMRRRWHADRAYSLIGLVHTIAPPTLRQIIAQTAIAPMHAWDALICTSPAVRDGLARLFEGLGQHLAERTGGKPPPHPALPVVPLGVDAAALAARADRPDARAAVRARFGLSDDAVLVLWVGRLSYYEKAFPQPMFEAVQRARAQAATGATVAFVMAGWFPDAADQGYYEAAAQAHAPDVMVHFADGNDQALLGDLWAGADIFLSLVDNIQETFGITPLEAMAAGVPVVASDWDGYRSTVRHGVDGFLVPTLTGPTDGGVGAALVERHVLEQATYQAYVGSAAQHTAVHIGRAAEALSVLIRSPELRRRMGAAGRARVTKAFDWPVVARQVHALTDELAQVRAAAADPPVGVKADPVKGDPFRDFANFASHVFTLDTRLAASPRVRADDVRAAGRTALDTAFPSLRAPPELCAEAFSVLEARRGAAVRDVLLAFPTPQRRWVEMGLAWMAKYGFVDWLTDEGAS